MDEFVFYPQKEERIDIFLAEALGFTRSRVKSLIDDGNVLYNGEAVKKSGLKVKGGEITVTIEEPVSISAEPEDIDIDIVYQDDQIAVINKAQGMVTHPCSGTPNGTLVNAIMYHIKDLCAINGVLRPGIVHRLDKDTTGLIVIAKTNEAHLSLAKQIGEKTAGRYYLALVNGNIKEDEGTIDAPLGRSPKDRKKIAVVPNGKRAVSHFKVVKRYGDYTLVEFKLETGRTHQIRVHAKYINHSVVGDMTYGKKDAFGLNGQLLHAYKLELTHPKTGERMVFTCDLPDYYKRVLEKLEKAST
ncbi:MAG: RluA family pseudouridine synthase [Clostridia bacterium]|nr:RluA family pseudouridine synthase [Clostridia bacterium]